MIIFGKLSGTLIAIIMGFGIPGALAGLVLGHIADHIIYLRLKKRRLAAFYSEPESSPLDIEEMKTAVLSALACSLFLEETHLPAMLRKEAVPFISQVLSGGGSPRLFSNLCLESFLETENRADTRRIASAFRRLSGIEERKEAFASLVSANPQSKKMILEIAEAFMISDDDFRKITALFPDSARDQDLRILGLTPGASPGEIKQVYRTLASQFHPDSGSGLEMNQQKILEETFIRIHSAYSRLISTFPAQYERPEK